jgi:hypothetical protein
MAHGQHYQGRQGRWGRQRDVPDGTVVTIASAAAPTIDNSATEVDRWFEANAS